MSSQLDVTDIGDTLAVPEDRNVVTIGEWESSDQTYELTDRDRNVLEDEINHDATRVRVEYDQHGEATFRARQFVGVVALPDGPAIQITPKAAGENLLHLLRYSQQVTSTTAEQRVGLRAGASFVDALAALFTTELETVLQRGLHKEYRTTESARSHVRGRIDLQKQLQRQGTTPTAFECRYSEQTRDTIANQAFLYAGTLLKRLVSDPELRQKLDWQTSELRQTVELRPVSPRELDQVDVTRLNDYYTDLLRLTEPILRNMHIENFEAGFRESFSLLVNMNTVFEQAGERALREVTDREEGLEASRQARTTNLIQGTPNVEMYPDFVVESTAGDEPETVLVGDMKWKTGSVDNSDIYQITSYILARDAPGVLVYPQQDGDVETDYTVDDEWPLSVVELETSEQVEDYEEFVDNLEDSVEDTILSVRRDGEETDPE